MYRIIYNLIAVFISVTLMCSCQEESGDLSPSFVSSFQEPPEEYKPMPFWHINGHLTREGIRQQMIDAKELGGFSGISVLPLAPKKNGRPGTTPMFLSPEYLERFQDVLDVAEELEMEVILYDDNDFPSGMAGGQLGELYPEHTMKRLDKIERSVRGPAVIYEQVPEGKILSIVAMNTESLKRKNLTELVENGKLKYALPNGDWRLMYFVVVKDSWHKAYPVVDYLDTTAVKKLMELTYEVHEENFGDYFGNIIKKVFFDDVGFFKHPRTWTGRFNDKFLELHGYDPAPWYPALWYDIGPETAAVRNAFFSTRAELLSEGFPRLVGEWAARNGLTDTGHPPGNYDPTPIDMNADIFKFYRHTAMPLTDAIIAYQFGQNGHKLISSAADYDDKPLVATEIYGAYKEQSFDSLMLYRAMMDLFVRGVNFSVPHGLWYRPEQVYISPLVSPYSDKIAAALPAYSEYVGRSCMMLQGGRRVADIGVLYPFEELAGWYRFDDPDNPRQGFFVSPETDYQEVSGLLTNEIRQDFTFIHPEYFLEDKYQIDEGSVFLDNKENWQRYKALIITGCHVISHETLAKVKTFYESGGVVIATTQLPHQSSESGHDQDVVDLIKDIFGLDPSSAGTIGSHTNTNDNGGKAFFFADPSVEGLRAAINTHTAPDVEFSPPPQLETDFGKFSYIHKIKDGRDIYFFSNSSDEAISTDVTLRGIVELYEADPHTGAITPLPTEQVGSGQQDSYTIAKLTLAPVRSVFWISK